MEISVSKSKNKSNPATYKQVKFFESLGGTISCAPSQLTTKLDRDVMSDAIAQQQDGTEVVIDY